MHILLADDDLGSQKIIKRILESRGHLVTTVTNGQDAVEAVEQWQFDVILMDIQMPVMDGFAATVKIREREQLRATRTPILAVTSHEFGEMFLHAGMDGYVEKPVGAESLLQAIQSAQLRMAKRSESEERL